MNLVKSVFDIAESFMQNSEHVEIDFMQLELVANSMKLTPPKKFPKQIDDSDQFKATLMELVGDSINYCYWYGSSLVRPGGASAGKMYEILETAFKDFSELQKKRPDAFDICLDNAIKLFSLNRFPMLEERVRHINELRANGEKFAYDIVNSDKKDLEKYLQYMVQIFPGYASDMFLKRAMLFFAQLNRKFGWFKEALKMAPVPADYQVPKMLEHYGVLEYDEELEVAIENEVQIAKGSLPECEIRAATIMACGMLCRETGWSMPDVDGYFWLRRKEAENPFHLTVTSDY